MFVLVLTGQLLATGPVWSRTFTVLGWAFWAAFATEFALRARRTTGSIPGNYLDNQAEQEST